MASSNVFLGMLAKIMLWGKDTDFVLILQQIFSL